MKTILKRGIYRLVTFSLLFYISGSVIAETPQDDSLRSLIRLDENDSAVAVAMFKLASNQVRNQPDSVVPMLIRAVERINKMLLHAGDIKTKKSLLLTKAKSLRLMGNALQLQGNVADALRYLHQSLEILEKLQNRRGMSMLYHSLGYIYMQQNDLTEALSYFKKCLKTRQAINDLRGEASILNDLGFNYKKQDSIAKALECFNKSYKIDSSTGNKSGMAYTLINIGYIYKTLNDTEKTMHCFYRSLNIQKSIEDLSGIAYTYSNIAYVLWQLEKHDDAIENYRKSLKIRRSQNDKESMLIIIINMAKVYYDKHNLPQAIYFSDSAMTIAKRLGFPRYIKDVSHLLYRIYKFKADKGDRTASQKALDYYELYIQMRDSINNNETQKAAIQQQMQYEYKKEKAVSEAEHQKELEKQQAIADAENTRNNIIIIAISGGLIMLLIFAVFIVKRLKITRMQKTTIEHQKAIVEMKNKEITDSITYAKRIQSAILPSDRLIKKHLRKSFILYKPKDIVAGDFYWFNASLNLPEAGANETNGSSPSGKSDRGIVLFAACDCTGHGVPGAMVSVVCHNSLNRSVKEYHLSEPGDILDKTRELVIAQFEKSDEDVKDGMDIALCSLELKSSLDGSAGGVLKYAGANNPLWIITSSPDGSYGRKKKILKSPGGDKYLLEIKADKQPIGKYADAKPFSTHSIVLNRGDSVYIFSDGYADQFGGDKGKKFKTKTFKELLLSIQDKSMEDQYHIIDDRFKTWKGELEQVDDICVIGVQIP